VIVDRYMRSGGSVRSTVKQASRGHEIVFRSSTSGGNAPDPLGLMTISVERYGYREEDREEI
jgi:hypothetical protein